MKIASLSKDIIYGEEKPSVTVLFETENTKEIRIVMKKGQLMKEHKTPFPIVVEIFDGQIEFGVNGETLQLEKGGLVALDGDVPHDLVAKQDSTVRLTLSKQDRSQRARDVVSE